MTRVNLLAPKFLCDAHLLAELRELPRIPSRVYSGNMKPIVFHQDLPPSLSSKVPYNYTVRLDSYPEMGQGHYYFFSVKLRWLYDRYSLLLAEYKRRFNKPYYLKEVSGETISTQLLFGRENKYHLYPEGLISKNMTRRVFQSLTTNYTPTKAEIGLSILRLLETYPYEAKHTLPGGEVVYKDPLKFYNTMRHHFNSCITKAVRVYELDTKKLPQPGVSITSIKFPQRTA